MSKQKKLHFGGLFWTVMFFALLTGLTLFATAAARSSVSSQGLVVTKQNINRAVVQCYALEGAYPPSIAYLEENYGIYIDHSRYVVFYQSAGDNLLPQINVVEMP